MRSTSVLITLLVACGGEGDTNCDAPADMDVLVTVTDSLGAPVTGAPVDLDGEPCTDNGDGTYDCVAHPDGNGQLSIVDGRYNAFSEFLPLPSFECENDPFATTAMLMPPMGM